jgi:hypothetical protein
MSVVCLQFGEHPLPASREIWWSLSDHTPSQTDRYRIFRPRPRKSFFKKSHCRIRFDLFNFSKVPHSIDMLTWKPNSRTQQVRLGHVLSDQTISPFSLCNWPKSSFAIIGTWNSRISPKFMVIRLSGDPDSARESNSSPEADPDDDHEPGDTNMAILAALSEQPFASIRKLSGLTHICKWGVQRRPLRSLHFRLRAFLGSSLSDTRWKGRDA